MPSKVKPEVVHARARYMNYENSAEKLFLAEKIKYDRRLKVVEESRPARVIVIADH